MKLMKRLRALFSAIMGRPNEEWVKEYVKPEVKLRPKLEGFDYLDILHVWVKSEYSGSHVVILTDVNTEAKDVEFWARIPKGQALEFLKDVIILNCKDKTELEKLVPSIGTKFATAYGFSDGELFLTNKEL